MRKSVYCGGLACALLGSMMVEIVHLLVQTIPINEKDFKLHKAGNREVTL